MRALGRRRSWAHTPSQHTDRDSRGRQSVFWRTTTSTVTHDQKYENQNVFDQKVLDQPATYLIQLKSGIERCYNWRVRSREGLSRSRLHAPGPAIIIDRTRMV
jgi:hypothetical protein